MLLDNQMFSSFSARIDNDVKKILTEKSKDVAGGALTALAREVLDYAERNSNQIESDSTVRVWLFQNAERFQKEIHQAKELQETCAQIQGVVNSYYFSQKDPVGKIFDYLTPNSADSALFQPRTHLQNPSQVSKDWRNYSLKKRLEWVEKKLISLKIFGFKSADEVIRFAAEHNMQNVNLTDFSDFTDDDLKMLIDKCPNLQQLNLCGTEITDEGFKAITEKCPNLQQLNLTSTGVTDEGLKTITEKCPNLLQLDLAHTQVTDEGIAAIAEKCPNLQQLNLAKVPQLATAQSLWHPSHR
jgi:phage FluMu protein Com